MTDQFVPATPVSNGDGGDMFKSAEHDGELLLVKVMDYRPEITTAAGTSDAISAEITVLDGNTKGKQYPDALLFGKALVPTLRPHVGSLVLGRLGRGNAQPGKSAPWILQTPTEADNQVARAHLANPGLVSAAPPF